MVALGRARLLFVVFGFLLSEASGPKQVAAHAAGRATPRAERVSPEQPTTETGDFAVAVPQKLAMSVMLDIPEGDYLPFYKGKSGTQATRVPHFRIAAQPVTSVEFLRFVERDRRFRRSRVERLFAEASYLVDWSSDLQLGAVPANSALTGVSWFAAKAYCKSLGARLPTTVEWERALYFVGSSFTDSGLRDIPDSLRAMEIGTLPATGKSSTNPADSLWEWTADFNSLPLAADDSGDSASSLFCGAGARATDATDYAAFLRYSFRSSLKANFALKNLGFRCAVSSQ